VVEEQGGGVMLSAVRTMQPNDVASAMELSSAANWNQTPEDWCRIMQIYTEGCRCIGEDGRIVATTSLLPYGTHLAWIGMVLTRPEYRRLGLARHLMEDAIAAAERYGIRTLKLDATDEGRPLYESLGFVVESIVERWGREGEGPAAASTVEDSASRGRFHPARISDEVLSQDAKAFGVERRTLLEMLSASGRCDASANGYVLSRSGRTARYLGPCVATSETEAQQLITAHLASEEHEGSKSCNRYWDLLPSNAEAVRLAERFRFTRRRSLWRMRRGEIIENHDAMVYAIAGFELG
jgi:GNAT superfamily N-acetyltransferase